MTWLITGGCGFVGSNLADALLSSGNEVVVFDNLSRVGSRQNLSWLQSQHGDEWHFVEGDIRDEHGVATLIQEVKPTALAHLAGQVAMTTSLQNPRLDFEINALGSLNVLEGVRQYSPETIVLYSSTNKVYGDLDWVRYEEHETRYVAPDFPNGFDETIPLNFHSPYGCSKGAADQYMLDYARMYGMRTVVFRHSSMYGGRQFATYDQGWIGWFCQKAVETKRSNGMGLDSPIFTISGNGKQVRDVLHADDIIRLYISAANSNQNVWGRAFNVGGGMNNSLSLLELFELLNNILGIQLVYKQVDWRHSDQKIFVANLGALNRLYDFKVGVQPKHGISLVIDWLQKDEYSTFAS